DLVWSQMHGSFVLLPAIVAIALAGELLQGGLRSFVRRLWLPAVLGIGGVLIAPAGLEHLELVRAHSLTDAAHYIQELKPLDPAELSPKVAGAFLWLDLLLFIGATRSLLHRRLRLDDFLLAFLGLLMTFTARRFRSMWPILAAPWAARGYDE